MSFRKIMNSIAGEGMTNVLVGAGISAALAGIVATFMTKQSVKRVEQSNNAAVNQMSQLIGGVLSNEITCAASLQPAGTGMPAAGPVVMSNAGGNAIPSLRAGDPNVDPTLWLGTGNRRVALTSLQIATVQGLDGQVPPQRAKITIRATFTSDTVTAEGVVAEVQNEERLYTVFGSIDPGNGNAFSCRGNFTGEEQRPETFNHVCNLIMNIEQPANAIGPAIVFRNPPTAAQMNDQTNMDACFTALTNEFDAIGGVPFTLPLIMDQMLDAVDPAGVANPICDNGSVVDAANGNCRYQVHGSTCASGMMTGVNGGGATVACSPIIIAPN